MLAIKHPEQGDHIEHAPSGLGRADRQLATLKAGQRIELHPRVRDRGQDPPGIANEQLARRGCAHAPTGALKQARIQLRLQALDLMTQRRLHHVALLRGPRKAQTVRHRHDVLELPKIHLEAR